MRVVQADPVRSAAVFIGQGHYRSDELRNLPQAPRGAKDLAAVLTTGSDAVLRRDRCAVVTGRADARVSAQLAEAARSATDLLLVYYAGHGLLDGLGRLHLALSGTDPGFLAGTALPADLLAEIVRDSPARHRVVILDCSFAASAIDAIAEQSAKDGTHCSVIAPYGKNQAAPEPAPAERHTAFTDRLLTVLNASEESDRPGLTLPELDRRLREASGPAEQAEFLWQSGPAEQLDLRRSVPPGPWNLWSWLRRRARLVLLILAGVIALVLPSIMVNVVDHPVMLDRLPAKGDQFTQVDDDQRFAVGPDGKSVATWVIHRQGWALSGGQRKKITLKLPPGRDHHLAAQVGLTQVGSCPGGVTAHHELAADGLAVATGDLVPDAFPLEYYAPLGRAGTVSWTVSVSGDPSCHARVELIDSKLHTVPPWLRTIAVFHT
ncbi:hypothetical protein GCM10010193_04850 [Kitasatospora atroaurantiaca]|uniref:Peptidase C14 caspase domain-containing protein n=1 Tax=Kitasatospora atroaurantiaca TaxID=285545 RepID=A0A561EM57_9ACTN|nr:caspase family protein [Kitasatospora atroaurantiaca]TWE16701.1 hypothetical protein FB465_1684 [Kitasatospora atroaurantiaca]